MSKAQKTLPPDTTAQEDLTHAGQRRINLIWEITQSVVAVMITGAMIYAATQQVESKELNYAFVSIVTMYFVRTNHKAIGGVGPKPKPGVYEGR